MIEEILKKAKSSKSYKMKAIAVMSLISIALMASLNWIAFPAMSTKDNNLLIMAGWLYLTVAISTAGFIVLTMLAVFEATEDEGTNPKQ